MKNKIWMVGCSMAVMVVLATGCSSQSSAAIVTSAAETSIENAEMAVDKDAEDAVANKGNPREAGKGRGRRDKSDADPGLERKEGFRIAEVTSVEGNTITAVEGIMRRNKNGGPRGLEGGDLAEKPDGVPENDNSDMEKPETDNKDARQMPKGPEKPEVTFTVGDDTKITVQNGQESSEGSIDNIAVGSMLELSLGDGNIAKEITVIHRQEKQ